MFDGFVSKLKGWLNTIFASKAEDEFGERSITSPQMESALSKCIDIYFGRPEWVDSDAHVKTINFAKSICSEIARLATLAIGVHIDGSARAEWLQSQIDKIYFRLRGWVEYGCAYGTVILKPNGNTIDLYVPGQFIVTEQQNGEIAGIVFITKSKANNKYYTRLEHHKMGNDGIYTVTNRCYIGDSENDLSTIIDIGNTPWAGLSDTVKIANVNKPLFGVFNTPHANNIDIDSALSLPIFSEAIEELKDLDIAYSRHVKEINDSARTVLLDSDRLLPTGGKVAGTVAGFDARREELHLPDYVKTVYGDGNTNFYQEINPTLNTDVRISGINALLSQIGYKVGFSNGYFVFNALSGLQTATGVEAEQQRTIQLVKDVRDKLENCIDNLLYAVNVFADLYDLAPVGEYNVTYDFGDITYNREEDKARWYGYVLAGKIPFWYYLNKFEGYTEDDAKALEQSAVPIAGDDYGAEE